ncbi:MAG: hypothetical protein Q9192_003441 [Flavoplaca navasiana]
MDEPKLSINPDLSFTLGVRDRREEPDKAGDEERGQVDVLTPKAVKQMLGNLASAFAFLGILKMEANLINANSLPPDVRNFFDYIKKALPLFGV